eukprot:1383660-Amorphochlora_amoeboformis.AAC.1
MATAPSWGCFGLPFLVIINVLLVGRAAEATERTHFDSPEVNFSDNFSGRRKRERKLGPMHVSWKCRRPYVGRPVRIRFFSIFFVRGPLTSPLWGFRRSG